MGRIQPMPDRDETETYLEAFLELLGEAQRDLPPNQLHAVLSRLAVEVRAILDDGPSA